MFSSRNFAIGMAHFRIAGGWKTLALVCAGYIGAGLLIASLIFYANRDTRGAFRPSAFHEFATIALVIEAFILVIFGSLRISACIRSDVTSNMIESHRLMPIASWRAVAGYLFGATVHPLALTVLNVALAYGLALYGGVRSDDIAVTQMVLFSFALFIWCVTAMGTLMFRQMFILTFFGLIAGICGSAIQVGTAVLPGFSLLLSPFIGQTIFNFPPTKEYHLAYSLAIAMQLAFCVILFIGACRRYRGTFLTTLNEWQGLVLAALWTILSFIGILGFEKLGLAPRRFDIAINDRLVRIQMIASLATGLILAVVPIWALAAREKSRKLALWQPILVCAAGLLLIAPLLWLVTPSDHQNTLVKTVSIAVVAAHILTVYFTFLFLKRASTRFSLIGIILTIGTLWILPFIAEMIRWFIMEPDWDRASFGVLATFSPIGILATQWNAENPPQPFLGLLAQFALPLLLAVLIARRDRRTKSPRPEQD